MSETDTAQDVRWTPKMWGLLSVLCFALLLDGLDVTLVGVALPSIGADLDMSTSDLQWIVNGYLLGYGALLLLGGRTADLVGRRTVFLVSLTVFALASLMGGLVDDGTLVIISRFIKGVAAAFTVPTGLSIITTTFPEGPQRNKAVAIYTAFGAAGFSSGLIIGGLMTELHWRWTFLFSVPVAAGALIAGFFLIPKDRPSSTGRYDFPGALTLTAGMLLLVYAVVEAPSVGWTDPQTILAFVGVVLLLGGFAMVERKVSSPLVPLAIFRRGALMRANLSFIALLGSYFSFQFLITLYLQETLDWTPLELALALLPIGLIVAFGAPMAGKLIGRFSTATLIVFGLASEALGFLLLLRMDTEPSYVTMILPTVVLVGIGFAFVFPCANVQAVTGVEPREQGLAAGMIQASGQVGAAVVLAVTTAIIATEPTAGTAPSPQEVLDQFQPGLVFGAAVALAGTVLVQIKRRTPRNAATTSAGTEAEQAKAESSVN
ncbi:MFS transporter [Streptomyces sp. WMMC1477]|uniref:MFS transporter n=1 Tax=Streptomyces sp. WMMC1477 TaxID=3015155 RepID=UPI0022B69886|nr:MFS transporter [Streptomyces sp. WMMC1477]MCZ7431120.1 MFS transporter [Streptomyces sp. WMMC1477]